ncbi:hypothetical protein QJS04_geneDACA016006 [Acorus gramineus]|uniref:Uncharacterized protein n=1 Tax=Acorus gramineus TaxID=55184 RepID=A0AAV9BGX8_ACOGR|nr:hypothetical protein QJS04_geneDACA016006 [Acorus gramineus]
MHEHLSNEAKKAAATPLPIHIATLSSPPPPPQPGRPRRSRGSPRPPPTPPRMVVKEAMTAMDDEFWLGLEEFYMGGGGGWYSLVLPTF